MPITRQHKNLTLLGHRGVTGHVIQENTLDAFAAALESGCQGIETDVRLTSDKHLILHHHRRLPNNKAIADCDLRECTIALGFEPPGLAQALDAFPGCVWNLEIKTPDVLTQIHVLRRQVEKIEHLYVSSFDHSLLARLKQLLPCPVFALTATLPQDKHHFLSYLEAGAFDGVVWDYEIVRDDYICHLREHGKQNACYGLASSDELTRCDLLGFEYAIVDSFDLIDGEAQPISGHLA